MPYQEFKQPLELWVNEDLVLPECRPSFLLMHETLRESNPELEYWNLLREILPKIVKVHRFKNLKEAGSLVITPNDYRDYLGKPQKNALDKFKKEVLDSGRKLITFTPGMEYQPEPGELAFATSVYQLPDEKLIPMPTWLYDLRTKISAIPKPPMPTIGFVGNTRYPGRISSLAGRVPLPQTAKSWLASSRFVNQNISLGARRGIGRLVRTKVLQVAQADPRLDTQIIARTGDYFLMTPAEKQRARAEYIQHIQDNAYTICMRGDNNDNYQMYEVMSAGRIPILIDTNLQRPTLKNSKWEDFCVIVPFQEIHRLGEIVADFHRQLSPEDFLAVCQKSRAAFEELLPHNFVFQILQEIANHIDRDLMPIGTSNKNQMPLTLGQ